jgi:hypothetical protein
MARKILDIPGQKIRARARIMQEMRELLPSFFRQVGPFLGTVVRHADDPKRNLRRSRAQKCDGVGIEALNCNGPLVPGKQFGDPPREGEVAVEAAF